MNVIEPFKKVYEDACRNILVYNPGGDRLLVTCFSEF